MEDYVQKVQELVTDFRETELIDYLTELFPPKKVDIETLEFSSISKFLTRIRKIYQKLIELDIIDTNLRTKGYFKGISKLNYELGYSKKTISVWLKSYFSSKIYDEIGIKDLDTLDEYMPYKLTDSVCIIPTFSQIEVLIKNELLSRSAEKVKQHSIDIIEKTILHIKVRQNDPLPYEAEWNQDRIETLHGWLSDIPKILFESGGENARTKDEKPPILVKTKLEINKAAFILYLLLKLEGIDAFENKYNKDLLINFYWHRIYGEDKGAITSEIINETFYQSVDKLLSRFTIKKVKTKKTISSYFQPSKLFNFKKAKNFMEDQRPEIEEIWSDVLQRKHFSDTIKPFEEML